MKASEFIAQMASGIVLDVRSPAEYAEGHIPGAVSFPIFSDEERKQVGICYKRKGRESAVALGLELVGPRMKDISIDARKLADSRPVFVHCWRGGMRSQAMAWLMEFSGLEVNVLEGGYKAYRKFMYEQFEDARKYIVLGGMTGSAKTEILHALREKGEQVLDLEGIAKHKGSAFGNLEQVEQPSVEHFQNELFVAFSNLDSKKVIWVEDESQHIGKVWINDQLFRNLKKCPLVIIRKSVDDRVEHLNNVYGSASIESLKQVFEKISRRLGGQHMKRAHESLDEGDLKEAARIALTYYDKTYSYMINGREELIAEEIEATGLSHQKVADLLIEAKKGVYGES